MRERARFERELACLGVREYEDHTAPPPDTVDEDTAEPVFAQSVRDRVEPLLSSTATAAAVKSNGRKHPSASGVALAAIANRLSLYLNRPAIEKAMRDNVGLKDLASDDATVIAVMTHQFQHKIYAESRHQNGQIGEGTLDALGFVRHQGNDLNSVDIRNDRFHSGKDGNGKSATFRRLESVYRSEKAEFEIVAPDLAPKTWFSFFVNPPFLGRPFRNGVHLELMKRLRDAEKRLAASAAYASMNPVELGAALGIDEDHGGGRVKDKASASMHTFGLAVDIGSKKNPWVAGQEGSPTRNRNFRAVSINVSRLINGTRDELTPGWLNGMGTDSSVGTGPAFDAIKKRHDDFLKYLTLERDPDALKAILRSRSGAADDAEAKRWRGIIRADRAKLHKAFGSGRKPEDGFLNLARDLVVALRDTGCLAWGAIDIGPNQSGDMMHFDCRVTGIGRVVQHPSGHTVSASHPCLAVPQAGKEIEIECDDPRTVTFPHAWTFTPKTIAIKIALFVPTAAAKVDKVELLVYAHGRNTCAPKQKDMPLSFITDDPFKLGDIVEASKRSLILAVPFFDLDNLVANKMNIGDKKPAKGWHKLGIPKTLNSVIAEILKEAGGVTGRGTPSLTRLILAAHSGGYRFLDPLAEKHADAEMSKDPLAKLTHVWGFDTTYSCPGPRWENWIKSKNAPNVSIFFGGHKDGTLTCGEDFQSMVKKSKGKLSATRIGDHCSAPTKNLPTLLKALP